MRSGYQIEINLHKLREFKCFIVLFNALSIFTIILSVSVYANGISTYSEIERFIYGNPTASLDHLLAGLSPNLKGPYSIVYHGRGKLGSSYDNPSIVVGPPIYQIEPNYAVNDNLESPKTEKIFFAFRAHNKGENSNILDLIIWNPKLRTTEFKQILFPDGVRSRSTIKNGEGCMNCHGGHIAQNNFSHRGGRVVFDAYPFWPGTIGSHDRINMGDFPKLERDLTKAYLGAWNNRDYRFQYFQAGKFEKIQGPLSDSAFLINLHNMESIIESEIRTLCTTKRQYALNLYDDLSKLVKIGGHLQTKYGVVYENFKKETSGIMVQNYNSLFQRFLLDVSEHERPLLSSKIPSAYEILPRSVNETYDWHFFLIFILRYNGVNYQGFKTSLAPENNNIYFQAGPGRMYYDLVFRLIKFMESTPACR